MTPEEIQRILDDAQQAIGNAESLMRTADFAGKLASVEETLNKARQNAPAAPQQPPSNS
jgi:hypothetical protein